MSDIGNTATQVSPNVTETDMNKAREVFNNMIDRVVEGTKLAGEVQEIRKHLQELQSSMDYLRQRNAELDSLLADVRRQRDEAQTSLAKAEADIRSMSSTIESQGRYNNDLEDQIKRDNAALVTARKERDDALFRNMELTEELAEAKAKLAEISEFAERFVQGMKPKAPEPTNIPDTTDYEPVTQPQSPPPVQTAGDFPGLPASTRRKVYQDSAEFSWNRPHEWDQFKGMYGQYVD